MKILVKIMNTFRSQFDILCIDLFANNILYNKWLRGGYILIAAVGL